KVIARHTGTRPNLTEPVGARSSGRASVPSAEQQRAQRFGSLGTIRTVPERAPAPQPTAAPAARVPVVQQDPRDLRVEAICDKILGELRSSPEAVKDIFVKPEETIAALRATCRNLTRRERDLRKFLSPQDDERLMREREALQKRISGELDDVTKMRLAAALAALDAQRDQRLELTRAAARF